MRTINIGRLNKRIIIYEKIDTINKLNQKTKTIREVGSCWASVAPIRSSERYEVQKLHEEVSYRIYMRYRDGIKADMYLSCEGHFFEITAVMDVDFAHKMLEIEAVEKPKKEITG